MSQGLSRSESGTNTPIETGERTLKVGDQNPIRVSAGHRILHHDGKCSRPHGHNYEVTVKITGELSEEGWVVDKGDVTAIIQEWDHMFLVEEGDPLIEAFRQAGDGESLVILEYPPTAEIMSVILEKRMANRFDDNVTDVSVSVRETGELCASH